MDRGKFEQFRGEHFINYLINKSSKMGIKI